MKIHLLLDYEDYLLQYVHITEGKVHEVTILKKLRFSPGAIVVAANALKIQIWTAVICDNISMILTADLPSPSKTLGLKCTG